MHNCEDCNDDGCKLCTRRDIWYDLVCQTYWHLSSKYRPNDKGMQAIRRQQIPFAGKSDQEICIIMSQVLNNEESE